jgi:very-short-patch-repair endonuclease
MARQPKSPKGETYRTERTCERCGKTYLPGYADRGRFCSLECYRAVWANHVEKTCPGCGGLFRIRASHAGSYNYCSLECKRRVAAAREAAAPPKNPKRVAGGKNPRPAEERSCETCGKRFQVVGQQRETGRYCSYECRYSVGRITITCAYCGKEKTLQRYRVEREETRCCSNRCAIRMRMENGPPTGYMRKKLSEHRRTAIEVMAEEGLQSLGLPYLFEHKVGRYLIDFALPTLSVGLECDGWHHRIAKVAARDEKRDAELLKRGWRVVRVQAEDLVRDPVAAIREALNLTSPPGQPSLPLR